MNIDLKSIVLNYNLRFIYKKVIWVTLVMVVVNIVSVLTKNSYELTNIDFIILSLGGYNFKNISIMTLLIAIFPYLMIAMIIERYNSEVINKNSIYTLIRIRDEKIYYIAHLITIAIIVLIIIAVYDLIIILFSINVFEFTSVISLNLKNINCNLKFYSLRRILLNIFIVQCIGVYAISLCQLCIIKLTKKTFIGFAFVMTAYILNFTIDSNFILIGSHAIITKINVLSSKWHGQSIMTFLTLNVLTIFFAATLITNKISLIKHRRKSLK